MLTARGRGTVRLHAMPHTLSEADSKELLAAHGVRFAPEEHAADPDSAVAAADTLGYPVAAKLCGARIAHKSERGLVRLWLGSPEEVRSAARELLAAALPEDDASGVLVAPMVSGSRELMAGIATDPQFGPTVLLGVGGVLAEAMADVAVRLAPITETDASEMIDELRSQAILGEFRGEPAVDRAALVEVLMALSEAATGSRALRGVRPSSVGPEERIVSADLNPLIVHDGLPVPVDALVELDGGS